MATIHLKQTTTATPGQFVSAITDFGPGRSKVFGNSSDKYLEVHDRGPTEADVTEGSAHIWERLHYDWSDPSRVVMKTTDSNVWGEGSGHTYSFAIQPGGTTEVDVVVVRKGKNLMGRALELAVTIVGERFLGTTLAKTVKAVEARGDGAKAVESTGV